jgi:hypothetical protein
VARDARDELAVSGRCVGVVRVEREVARDARDELAVSRSAVEAFVRKRRNMITLRM